MIVDLVSYTVFIPEAVKAMGYQLHPEGTVSPGDELIEVAGRECYQSWNRPNPATATNAGYLGNILNHKHFSVVEHVNIGFSIRDVSRSLTHELVRHRHFSFSQVSQRYVDESHGEFVVPFDVEGHTELKMELSDAHQYSLELYEKVTELLIESGVPRKRARQAARSVLPNGHTTRLLMTGNVTAWREFITKRTALDPVNNRPLADLEIYDLAIRILAWLRQVVPNAVQDLEDRPPLGAAMKTAA